ncbi:MAG: hypothetical protein JWO76_3188 [Nocardioides sp.]|nr:hypothetical protein [Nocardioides sp.]
MTTVQVDHGAFDRWNGVAAEQFGDGTDFDVVKKVWNDRGYWDIYLKETS